MKHIEQAYAANVFVQGGYPSYLSWGEKVANVLVVSTIQSHFSPRGYFFLSFLPPPITKCFVQLRLSDFRSFSLQFHNGITYLFKLHLSRQFLRRGVCMCVFFLKKKTSKWRVQPKYFLKNSSKFGQERDLDLLKRSRLRAKLILRKKRERVDPKWSRSPSLQKRLCSLFLKLCCCKELRRVRERTAGLGFAGSCVLNELPDGF